MLKSSEWRHMEGGRFGQIKSSYNFYRGRKILIHSSSCSIYDMCVCVRVCVCVGGDVIWGEGLAETFKIPSYGGKGPKIAQKPLHDIWTFPLYNFLHFRIYCNLNYNLQRISIFSILVSKKFPIACVLITTSVASSLRHSSSASE